MMQVVYENISNILFLPPEFSATNVTPVSPSHSCNTITTHSCLSFNPFPLINQLITSSSSFMCGMKSMVKLAMECLSSFSKHFLSDTHWQKELCSALSTRETRFDSRSSEWMSFSRVAFVLVGSLQKIREKRGKEGERKITEIDRGRDRDRERGEREGGEREGGREGGRERGREREEGGRENFNEWIRDGKKEKTTYTYHSSSQAKHGTKKTQAIICYLLLHF